ADGWRDVFVADAGRVDRPAVYVARRGHLAIDRAARRVSLVLEDGTTHAPPPERADVYQLVRFERLVLDLDWAAVFPSSQSVKSPREMSIAELVEQAAAIERRGGVRAAPLMEIHQRFAIPVACFVLALLGLS